MRALTIFGHCHNVLNNDKEYARCLAFLAQLVENHNTVREVAG